MTSSPEGRPAEARRLGDYAGRRGALPTWPRFLLVAALFAFILFIAKPCQDEQVRLTQAGAVELAKEQVDFEPENTQIRLLRQGLDRRPIWVISLSIAKGAEGPDPDVFKRLALVRIDATDGTVESVQEQGDASGEKSSDADQGQP